MIQVVELSTLLSLLLRFSFYTTQPAIVNVQRPTKEFLLAEIKLMMIFLPNRYVNASYE